MRNASQKYFTVLLILAVSSIVAFGQGSSGSLSGTVLDPKGAVVSGATVTVKNVATNQENTTETSGEPTSAEVCLGCIAAEAGKQRGCCTGSPAWAYYCSF